MKNKLLAAIFLTGFVSISAMDNGQGALSHCSPPEETSSKNAFEQIEEFISSNASIKKVYVSGKTYAYTEQTNLGNPHFLTDFLKLKNQSILTHGKTSGKSRVTLNLSYVASFAKTHADSYSDQETSKKNNYSIKTTRGGAILFGCSAFSLGAACAYLWSKFKN